MVFSWVEKRSFHKSAFLQVWKQNNSFFVCCCTKWSRNGTKVNNIAPLQSNLKHSWKIASCKKQMCKFGKIANLENTVGKVLKKICNSYDKHLSKLYYNNKLLYWIILGNLFRMTFFTLAMMKIWHYLFVFSTKVINYYYFLKMQILDRFMVLKIHKRWKSIMLTTLKAILSKQKERTTLRQRADSRKDFCSSQELT